MKKKLSDILNKKNKVKITAIAAYTTSITKIIDNYVDIILVGDSLGMTIYGMKNTQSVTLNMMKEHARAVNNSAKKSFTIVDMPYKTYENKRSALLNAKDLLKYSNCDAIKIETDESKVEIVKHLTDNNIKVVSHIGITPQKYKNFDKIKHVGQTKKNSNKLLILAKELEKAKTCIIVLECMKTNIAKKITSEIKIPTIGIGASKFCDGQILVINDILKIDNKLISPRFIKNYTNLNLQIDIAVKKYISEVKNKIFPSKKNSYN